MQVGSCLRGRFADGRADEGDFLVSLGPTVAAGPNERAAVQYFFQAFPTSQAPEARDDGRRGDTRVGRRADEGADISKGDDGTSAHTIADTIADTIGERATHEHDADGRARSAERTTYMFSYLRPGPEMPTMAEVLETYWRSLPPYQKISADNEEAQMCANDTSNDECTSAHQQVASANISELIEGGHVGVERVVFGWFPTYRQRSPLPPTWSRVLSVGDASAIQSPVSFGGFCSMLRHLPRLAGGLDAALRADALDRSDLALISPYLPNLATAWLTARAMSAVERSEPPAPSPFLNSVLEKNFEIAQAMPERQRNRLLTDITTLENLSQVSSAQNASSDHLSCVRFERPCIPLCIPLSEPAQRACALHDTSVQTCSSC